MSGWRWKDRLRVDQLIDRVSKTKVSVDHYDEMEDRSTAGGQESSAGGGQDSSITLNFWIFIIRQICNNIINIDNI